jgi:hypothetical protein
MSAVGRDRSRRAQKLAEASDLLRRLGFGPRQCNDIATYALLAMLDLGPSQPWAQAKAPRRGIHQIIQFVSGRYGRPFAENTRETIRDDAVKHFVAEGLLLKNPDDPRRPTNSGNTVYQMEAKALGLCQTFKTAKWDATLQEYLASKEPIKRELRRSRDLAGIPVRLPSGEEIRLSPGGQTPLVKAFIEKFCDRFVPDEANSRTSLPDFAAVWCSSRPSSPALPCARS